MGAYLIDAYLVDAYFNDDWGIDALRGGRAGGGRAGEDLVWGGPLCVYVVLCGLVKRYNENIVVFLLIKKCV